MVCLHCHQKEKKKKNFADKDHNGKWEIEYTVCSDSNNPMTVQVLLPNHHIRNIYFALVTGH